MRFKEMIKRETSLQQQQLQQQQQQQKSRTTFDFQGPPTRNVFHRLYKNAYSQSILIGLGMLASLTSLHYLVYLS